MNEYESLNHTNWECKYPVVFIPKYRRKALYASLRKHLGSLFTEGNGETLCGSIFGHGAIGCRRLDTTRLLCGCISKNKRRQTSAWTSWDCSEAKAALSGSKTNPL